MGLDLKTLSVIKTYIKREKESTKIDTTFTATDKRENIKSGENFSSILGKISRVISDLKNIAFSGSYKDLSDTPTIPSKTSQLTNDSDYKTTEDLDDCYRQSTDYTDTKIGQLINGAPETLDTLKEVADAIAEHQEVTDALNAAIGNKVDKVSGKGLSTNDYTTDEKNKLSGIASGAEVNVQADWNVTDSSNDAFIKNKPTIPTKTSDLTNDSGFKTADTTYDVVSKTANGLVPKLPNETTTTKYLRQDGTWTVPPDTNTTYSAATTGAAGLMSATDKTKLDGIAADANNYSLPLAATSTRGGVKIGYTASGKNYPVQLSNEKMYVNVPWTDLPSGLTNGYVRTGQKSGESIGAWATSEGYDNIASGYCSHAEELENIASGRCSHAEGYKNIASGSYSHAGGQVTVASGIGAQALGYEVKATNHSSFACGKWGKDMVDGSEGHTQVGDLFIIGNGTSDTKRSNALRITQLGDILGTKSFQSSGADYAEFKKPWADNNPDSEDRIGYFVTIKNGLLYKANEGDYITGITSGNPSVVGNADEDYYWRYERDEFNRIVMEDAPEMVQMKDDEGNLVFDEETHEPIMIETGNVIKNARMKFADDYDSSKQDEYIPREKRKEWDYVGMCGVIPVRDDGTCLPDHY